MPIKAIVFLLLIFFNACTNKKTQTEEIINLNRTQLNDDLNKLEKQKIITKTQSKQINERLNSDFDYYLKHQDIDLKGLEKMFFETVKSFENIKINQSIFIVISSRTYHTITSQIAIREFPIKQENYVIQSQLNKVINDWFDSYQNDSEKIADVIFQTNKEKELKSYPDISSSEYDDIISALTRIKNDSTISNDELKKILTEGMLKYCNKSNNSNLAILNIYSSIDRIKKLGIAKQLSDIYQKKWTKPKEPTYPEIKQQVLGRFKALLTADVISEQEYQSYTQIIIRDVEFCEKNKDKAQVKAQLLSGLKKLKTAELDTEDREAITDWYFILAQKTGVDIKNDLNKWLYDFDLN